MYWIVIIVVVILAFMVWASADVGSGIYLRSLCKGRTTERVVCLTFDDGVDVVMTPRVLDVLQEHDVKATFFIVGSKVDGNEAIVRRVINEGHSIGNHTYTHTGLFPLRGKSIVGDELVKCNEAIYKVAGRRPKLFRPPFGVTNPIIARVVRGLGLVTIGWSIRSLDTVVSTPREEVRQRVVRSLHPGAIILLHDRMEGADDLLRMLIPAIAERGYRFVSLEEMLNIDAYES